MNMFTEIPVYIIGLVIIFFISVIYLIFFRQSIKKRRKRKKEKKETEHFKKLVDKMSRYGGFIDITLKVWRPYIDIKNSAEHALKQRIKFNDGDCIIGIKAKTENNSLLENLIKFALAQVETKRLIIVSSTFSSLNKILFLFESEPEFEELLPKLRLFCISTKEKFDPKACPLIVKLKVKYGLQPNSDVLYKFGRQILIPENYKIYILNKYHPDFKPTKKGRRK